MDTHGSIIHIYYPVTYLSYIWFYWQNTSTKNEQPNMDTYGGISNVFSKTDTFILLMFHFVTAKNRREFSETWIRMAGEVIYIFYSYLFGLYVFHWQPRLMIMIMSVIKWTDLFYFITLKSIYLKYVHSGLKSKATISHDLCYVLGLYFNSSCMWQLSTYFNTGGCWNMLE